MFTWEAAFFNAGVSSLVVATAGHYFNVSPTIILFFIAAAGSLASVGFRWMGGHLKDWKQRCMAFISGVLLATTAVPYLASKGLEGLEAGVFVLGISLIGARFIKWASTDFDVGTFMSSIADKFIKKGE